MHYIHVYTRDQTTDRHRRALAPGLNLISAIRIAEDGEDTLWPFSPE